MIPIPIVAYILVIGVCIGSFSLRKSNSRFVGLIQGVALQMLITIPIAVLQLTGYVWKSWSIDTAEAIKVFSLSVLFDMAGWSVITPFEWLVPQRQTWVFSNLSEFGTLWIVKVMLVSIVIAWLRERYHKLWNIPTIIILVIIFVDDFITRDFPWWGS